MDETQIARLTQIWIKQGKPQRLVVNSKAFIVEQNKEGPHFIEVAQESPFPIEKYNQTSFKRR